MAPAARKAAASTPAMIQRAMFMFNQFQSVSYFNIEVKRTVNYFTMQATLGPGES
jgi:hypothetical protein